MTYRIAEKFKSLQGEGVYAGTPMAFIRFVGCSVGKRICQHCDTDFDKSYEWRGGGEFTAKQLRAWAIPYHHVCLTGGEPFNQDLSELLEVFGDIDNGGDFQIHVETSGTVNFKHVQESIRPWKMHVCVSPKPGFIEDMVDIADEVKVIVPGLGDMTPALFKLLDFEDPSRPNLRWPSIADALRWAAAGKTVFLQPRNAKFEIDRNNLVIVQDIIRDNPSLRLSVQLHKVLRVQ